jgi:hypothetical protein
LYEMGGIGSWVLTEAISSDLYTHDHGTVTIHLTNVEFNTLKCRICTGLSYLPDDKTSYCDAFLVCIKQTEWSSTLRRTSKCWTIVMHFTSIYQITNQGIVPWTYDDHPHENCVSTIVKKTLPWKLSLLFKKFEYAVYFWQWLGRQMSQGWCPIPEINSLLTQYTYCMFTHFLFDGLN